jgi:hypothetical protein
MAPDSECATGCPMRTTRFVMLAPLEVVEEAWIGDGGRAWAADEGLAAGDQPGDRERHRQPMVVEAVRLGPAQGGAAADPKVVALDRDVGAEGAQPVHDAGDPVDSLWRSSPAPRMTVVPVAAVAARQSSGTSSIAARRPRGRARRRGGRTTRDEVGDRLAVTVVRLRVARARSLRDVAPIERRMSMTARESG